MDNRHPDNYPDSTATRRGVVLLNAVITLVGGWTMFRWLSADDRITSVDILSLGLFTALFAWIAFSFSMSVMGGRRRESVSSSADGRPTKELTPESGESDNRVAILVPVYNENPLRVFAAVAAMREQLLVQLADHEADHQTRFDFYVLSDTTDPDVWLKEEWCWSQLIEQCESINHSADPSNHEIGIFYRHRSNNVARKSGNLSEFLEKWGSHYEHMIVLDADSLMTAETMLEMVHRMRRDPKLGILQVPPTPVGRSSLFARLQQFAAAVYGATFADAFDRFAGDQGNYFGHNAILRIDPFMRHCHLPRLNGTPPLGGEILSHDFVEAALLVRAGWKVRLATDLGGSFEECPTTIVDFAQRDHRWCQGNLQHFPIMMASGIHPISRLHFLSGIFSYIASPIWLMFLISGLLVAWTSDSMNATETTTLTLSLFAASMLLLLLPKMIAIANVLRDPVQRQRLGGSFRIISSTIVETLATVLLAPITAVYHTRFVVAVLSGSNVRWAAQNRDETGVSLAQAVRDHWQITLLGLIAGSTMLMTAPQWLIWFSPIIAGWLLSVPIAVAMASSRVGRWLGNWGLLQIESERYPEPILVRHRDWTRQLEATSQRQSIGDLFEYLQKEESFRSQHIAILELAGTEKSVMPEDPEWEWRQQPIGTPIPVEARARLLSDVGWLSG